MFSHFDFFFFFFFGSEVNYRMPAKFLEDDRKLFGESF